jgi:1-acyl-sn-glycerol-3-phosphate acyltransferase
MAFPLSAYRRAETIARGWQRWGVVVAFARLLAVAVMLAATCVNIFFCRTQASKRRLLAQRTATIFSILGVRVQIESPRRALPPPALFVCNHISWLDALAIQQYFGCSCVVKAEVFNWPIVGHLCRVANGISIKRGSAFGLVHTLSEVNAALRSNQSIGVFPEGTTSCGDAVLPFSHGVFQAAIDSQSAVQPLHIAYRNTAHSQSYAFVGDQSFLHSLWQLCLTQNTVMSIRCLPAIAPHRDRKELCATAHEMITIAHRRHKAVMNEWHDEHMED